LVIFTTAFAEYALDSYEVDAVDYLVKPIKAKRFEKAVDKAISYHKMLLSEERGANIEQVDSEFIFINPTGGFLRSILKIFSLWKDLKTMSLYRWKTTG